jgi:AsmA family protein
VTRPFDLGRFDATLSLQGRDLSDLYLLTGVALPNTPPYRLKGA